MLLLYTSLDGLFIVCLHNWWAVSPRDPPELACMEQEALLSPQSAEYPSSSARATMWAVETAVQVLSWLLDELSEKSANTHTHGHTHAPVHITDYRALSKWQSAFVQAFEILVTFLSNAQPNNKRAFMLRGRLGEGIDKTYFSGKRPWFVPSVSFCGSLEASYFHLELANPVCLCLVKQQETHASLC